MPKVLVVFDSADQNASNLAESVVSGVKSVRFAEVDVRVVGNEQSAIDGPRRRLESVDAVEQYDGVIVVGSDHEVSSAIDSLLTAIKREANYHFIDRVFAATPGGGAITQRLSSIGGIIVGGAADSMNPEMSARLTGERVAKVAEWIRHALSHEHGHDHSGGHSHHAPAHQHHSH